MQQVRDFLEECEVLATVLEPLPDETWDQATQFKGWTINDVIVHLHFWNRAADLALTDHAGFQSTMEPVIRGMETTGLRPIENAKIAERGHALFEVWQTQYREMAERWSEVDPKTRVAWIGTSMSARSSMTARQMETWAHGTEIFDLLGEARSDHDRIRNIVVLGINTFGWSHKVQGMQVPEEMPFIRLVAPSGDVWEFGDENTHERIEGPAVDFACVVTQARNIADTGLKVTGPTAQGWMSTAQCFAGPKEPPPEPGSRFSQA